MVLSERFDVKVEKTDDGGEKGVQGCIEQKADEVAKIPVANAGPHPWTVMVVDFNAEPTVGAVERPRRSDNLASSAIGKLLSQWWVKRLVFRDFEVS